jgi:hypothetical protein
MEIMGLNLATFFTQLFSIILMDLVLGGDNAIVIGMACRNLNKDVRMKGVVLGTVGAVIIRVIATLLVVWLLKIKFLMVIGGLLLIYIGTKLMVQEEEDSDIPADDQLFEELCTRADELELQIGIERNTSQENSNGYRIELAQVYAQLDRLLNGWEQLKVNNRYEICRAYPYQIRLISNKRVVNPFFDHSANYIRINLTTRTGGRRMWLLHRVIAEQWIPNPEHKQCVDHINGDTHDYRRENLRWATRSENSRNIHSHNRVAYEFVNELPDGAFQVTSYGEHSIENLYYSDDKFYLWNGIQYRLLRICDQVNSVAFVNVKDTLGNPFQLRYNVFKFEHNL